MVTTGPSSEPPSDSGRSFDLWIEDAPREKRSPMPEQWTWNVWMSPTNLKRWDVTLPKSSKIKLKLTMKMEMTWNVSAGRGVHMIVIRRPDCQTCVTQLWIPKNTSFIAEASLWKWGGGQRGKSTQTKISLKNSPYKDLLSIYSSSTSIVFLGFALFHCCLLRMKSSATRW